MSADKIVDRAVELLVYAPVGLVASARDLLPQLVERGRRQVDGQVTVARMVGEFAVRQGQASAGQAVERARQQAAEVLDGLAVRAEATAGAQAPASPAASPPSPAVPPVDAGDPVAAEPPLAPGAEATAPPPASDDGGAGAEGPSADGLAIPGYDALSASQVVPRLTGLSLDELEQVRAYEEATRRRKTILSKITQLQVP